MKQFRFVTLVMCMGLFSPSISTAQQCEDSSVYLGKIDSNWLYKNVATGISFQLPHDWYFFDALSFEKKYIKIGSDYRKLSEPTVATAEGPAVALGQIKSHPLDFSVTFFSLAKLTDSTPLVLTPNEFQQNKTVSCNAYYAETKEADTLLKALYKKFTGRADTPQVKDGRLGQLEYKYMTLSIAKKSGGVENRIYGVRNFGCFNIVIRIIYTTDADLAEINEACKDLKIE